ncbi:hypothetical protein [Hippea maritima]|uniref:Uncharacterized protein n=1 Tax=Hippea maritima (strain ATCC 700847 / DSM 10411 / MH2) TaxID=760142 RepID=F2LV50_HIPMA|nr:hypothetical protein [Hippea maritima]AEA33634.1 hypothetical protein Hipma_0664 [Hippea maritima DSM 10411]
MFLLQGKKKTCINELKALEDSKRFTHVFIETKAGREVYDVLETEFNGYGFAFILNLDKRNYSKLKDALDLIKDKNKKNKIKYSGLYFFTAHIPLAIDTSTGEQRIEISLIKESFNYIVGYKNIYQCQFFGNYPYDQKVFCENLYDLPLVFRRFIGENQNKPENFIKFFTKPQK